MDIKVGDFSRPQRPSYANCRFNNEGFLLWGRGLCF